jgi:hypothetical protein
MKPAPSLKGGSASLPSVMMSADISFFGARVHTHIYICKIDGVIGFVIFFQLLEGNTLAHVCILLFFNSIFGEGNVGSRSDK